MIHALNIKTEYFEDVRKGHKTFEIRKADRPFAIGDYLALNEIDEDGFYTGRALLTEVTYLLFDPEYCKEDYVTIGIKKTYVIGQEERDCGILPHWLLDRRRDDE